MKKDDLVYIGHMLESASDAVARTRGLGRSAFERDANLPLAITHLIQIIGEAARHVSADFRAAHPEIPWTTIVGMRHKLVHDYIHVDFDTVWETAVKDLPVLVNQLEQVQGV